METQIICKVCGTTSTASVQIKKNSNPNLNLVQNKNRNMLKSLEHLSPVYK